MALDKAIDPSDGHELIEASGSAGEETLATNAEAQNRAGPPEPARAPGNNSTTPAATNLANGEAGWSYAASGLEPFEAIFRNSTDVLTLMADDGRYLDVNDEFLRVTGYSRNEVVGRTPAELGVSFDPSSLQRIAQSLRAHGVVRNVEVEMRLRDGRELTVLWSAVMLSAGGRRRRLGISRDVTDLRRAESALHETESHLREVVEHAPLIISAIDRDGVYTLLEGRGARMANVDSARIAGRSAFEVHRDRPEMLAGMRRALAGAASTSKLELNGRHFEVWRGPIQNSAGVITGAFAVSTDISERISAEREILARLRQHEAVAHLAARALEDASAGELLEEAVETAHAELRADFASALEYDVSGRVLRMRATTGDDRDQYLNYQIDEREESLSRFVLRANEPVVSEDLIAETRFRPHPRLLERGARSGISAAIRSHGRNVGVLSAFARTARPYSREDTGFMRSLANVLAVAIERSRGERRLRESESYLRTLIENSTDVIVVLDAQNRIRFVNGYGASLFGQSAEAIVGRAGTDFVHPQDLPIRDRSFAFARANFGVPARCELRLLAADGRWRVCEIVTRAIEQLGGEADLLVNLRDISERRAAEQAQALLASIVTASDDAIMSFEINGSITSWNGGAERLYGHPAERMIGRGIEELLPADAVKDIRRRFARIAAGAPVDHYETRRTRSDGTAIDVAVTLSPIRDAGGAVTGVATTVRDITERKREEEELRRARDAAVEATRLKTAFLANMSHEIRTPINIILGYGDLIGDYLAERGDSSQAEYLEAIGRASRRLLRTINGILDYSRLESGNFQLDRKPLALAPLVTRQAEEARAAAAEKGLAISVEIDDSSATARADEYCLTQALRQVIDNAIKFTEKGCVRLRLARADADGGATIAVTDTGVGIDEAFLPHLLEPFSQEDYGHTRKFEGVGLGLALARRYLEPNEATLTVSSRKGEGSTFIIRFAPLAPDRPQSGVATP